MSAYKAWDAENSDEEDAHEVHAGSAWSAALNFVEGHWAYMDHPESVTVEVRDSDGTLTRWLVRAEPSVSFRATRVGT